MTNAELHAASALAELPREVRRIADALEARERDALLRALAIEIEAIREKERFFWGGARPSLGPGAVALLLDGIASRLEIVCGFAPMPKGGLKPPAPLYAKDAPPMTEPSAPAPVAAETPNKD